MKYEDWKDIKGYEGYYQISNMGRVKSLPRAVLRDGIVLVNYGSFIIKPFKRGCNNRKYLAVHLCRDNQAKAVSVHKLVAEAFISNPENKPQVNHKDCNGFNNAVYNLEWVTIKENAEHAFWHSKKIKYNARESATNE